MNRLLNFLKLIFCVNIITILVSGCSISDLQEYFNEPLKCESPAVKDAVITLYKKYDSQYEIAINNISRYGWPNILRVDLMYPVAKSYDESIKKYVCEGKIVHINDDGSDCGNYGNNREYSVQKTAEGTIVRLKDFIGDYYPEYSMIVIDN